MFANFIAPKHFLCKVKLILLQQITTFNDHVFHLFSKIVLSPNSCVSGLRFYHITDGEESVFHTSKTRLCLCNCFDKADMLFLRYVCNTYCTWWKMETLSGVKKQLHNEWHICMTSFNSKTVFYTLQCHFPKIHWKNIVKSIVWKIIFPFILNLIYQKEIFIQVIIPGDLISGNQS